MGSQKELDMTSDLTTRPRLAVWYTHTPPVEIPSHFLICISSLKKMFILVFCKFLNCFFFFFNIELYELFTLCIKVAKVLELQL